MTVFSFVLFVHVLSAIVVCIAVVLEGAALLGMRSAQNTDQLGFAVRIFRRLGPIYGIGFAGILLGGIYLAAALQLRAPWVPQALAATLVFLAVGGIVTGRRMARLRRGISQQQSFPSLRVTATGNSLVVSYGFRVGLLVGILFLMTATPPLLASLLALSAPAIGGVLIALRLRAIALPASCALGNNLPAQGAERS